MSKEIDIEIYKNISDEMDVAEIYLGHLPFVFHYTKAQYIATCTEAFPFNPFDKVICELLKIEEQLSFESIGDILGLNVYESENPKRYLDLAEKEILIEALQTLASDEFGRMIEGGDIHFSRCRLTTIGREYAQKKSKFKTTKNKPFTLYFDNTTSNHLMAKHLYEFSNGKLSEKQFAIELATEEALKEIAEVQIPEIYNPKKQFSFTDAVLKQQKNLAIEFPIAITFNSKEKSYRFYCYDTVNKNIHLYFNGWLNSSEIIKQELITEFSEVQKKEPGTLNDFLTIYAKQIVTFAENTKISFAKATLLKQEFIDEQLFYSIFNELFNTTEKVELYLCLPTISESIYKAISNIVQNTQNQDSRFFLVFPTELNESMSKSYTQLQKIADNVVNLYVMKQDVKSFLLLGKTEIKPFYFEVKEGSVNKISKNFFQKKVWDSRADKIVLHFLEKFSEEYAFSVCKKANELINSALQEKISKELLDKLEFYKFKLEPFKRIGKQGETVETTLEFVENFRVVSIKKLEETLNTQLGRIESELAIVSDEKEFSEIQKVFAAITEEIIFDNSEAFKRSNRLKIIIANKNNEFAEAKRIFNFIFDTNIFIKDPEIVSKIQTKHKIVIAAKVLDELDGFKANPQLKEIASKSIREIFNNKNKNIRRAKANVKLLPPDFNKRAPDNLILAVALIYKDNNGILISDDIALHEKAKTVDMQVIAYKDFISKFVNTKN